MTLQEMIEVAGDDPPKLEYIRRLVVDNDEQLWQAVEVAILAHLRLDVPWRKWGETAARLETVASTIERRQREMEERHG